MKRWLLCVLLAAATLVWPAMAMAVPPAVGAGETAVPVIAGPAASQSPPGIPTAHVPTPVGALLAQLSLQQAQLLAPDGAASDYLGSSVAIDGDTAVVGAMQHAVGANSQQGAAYVFTRSGTTWSLQQELTAAGGGAGDRFGYSVAVSGNTLLVGAPLHKVGSNADQGEAYVFTRSNTTWTLQQKLTAPDGAATDLFGGSVAVEGDTALVGAPYCTVSGHLQQGAAYVWVRSGTTWSQQQPKLTASDGAAGDDFGRSVALSGETAVVGDFPDDLAGNYGPGAAWVFTRSGTTWSQQQKLTASDGIAGDDFGYSVALSGGTAVVGADQASTTQHGAAYVFTRSGASWSQQQRLTASDGTAGDRFGFSVAVSGDVALVGAWTHTVDGVVREGSAYPFVRSANTWQQFSPLARSDGASGDLFGYSTALSGNTALVGAMGDSVASKIGQGAAYVYTLDTTAPTTTASIAPSPNAAGWDNAPVTVTLSASDNLSGVASTQYRLVGASAWTSYGAPFQVSAPGVSSYEMRSADAAGNVETANSFIVRIDGTPPITTLSGLPTGWVNHAVTLTLSADDALSGFAYCQYCLNGGAWTQGSSLTVASPGATAIAYRSSDNAGNLEAARNAVVRIDTGKPSTSATKNVSVARGRKATLRFKVSDPAPSCGSAEVTITIKLGKKTVKIIKLAGVATNKAAGSTFKVTLKKGTYRWTVKAADIAGNASKVSPAKKLTVK